MRRVRSALSAGIGFGLACLTCSLAAAAPGGIPGPAPHSAAGAALGAVAATGAAATGAHGAPAAAAATGAVGAAPGGAAASSASASPAESSGSSETGPAPEFVAGAALTAIDFDAIRAFLDAPVAIRTGSGGPRPQIEVIAAYVGAGGRPCRRVQETVVMNGESVLAWGDVCKERSGAWALMPSRR